MAINKHKVLIYDDKHEDCDLLSEMIKKICGEETVEITAVETYEEAMDLAWDDYCAAFLDIRLDKDKDGIRFAERLRSRSKELKIIFVTAYIKYCTEPSAHTVTFYFFEDSILKKCLMYLGLQLIMIAGSVILNPMNGDKTINILDLALLKRKLIEG